MPFWFLKSSHIHNLHILGNWYQLLTAKRFYICPNSTGITGQSLSSFQMITTGAWKHCRWCGPIGRYGKSPTSRIVKSGTLHWKSNTTKFLKILTPKKFAVITLKFEQSGFTVEYADEMANSVDHDQTAPKSSLIWVYTVCPDLSVQAYFLQMMVSRHEKIKFYFKG